MTLIRPELSRKNKYYIPKHRYYELLHFCRQYDDWKKELSSIALLGSPTVEFHSEHSENSTTERNAIRINQLRTKMGLVEKCADIAGEDLAKYIFLAVTKGMTYEALLLKYNVPCCRVIFYEYYRKFFWVLDKEFA